jgi:hypothetical protein
MSIRVFASLLAWLVALPLLAQTRTPWQMHDGLEVTPQNPDGFVRFTCSPVQHGDVCEYNVATIPPENDPGWHSAPDPNIINFSIPSRLCHAPITCLGYGDFTYFQTFVNVPADVALTTFTITFQGMDDGSRVSIYNSANPNGLVVPGSFVFLGGSGTSDLAPFVQRGEVNRVVVTQVDDCCSANNLRSASVVLNGKVLSGPASISLAPLNSVLPIGTPTDLQASVLDPQGHAVGGATVSLSVISGPEAGTTLQSTTDTTGVAHFGIVGRQLGADLVQASVVGLPLTSNQAIVTFTGAPVCPAVPSAGGAP